MEVSKYELIGAVSHGCELLSALVGVILGDKCSCGDSSFRRSGNVSTSGVCSLSLGGFPTDGEVAVAFFIASCAFSLNAFLLRTTTLVADGAR